MAKILEMPKLSPTMEEGQISAWHKKEGDAVAVDDLLAEVETDKATMEFRSFDKGTLLKILSPAGTMVKLGQPVAIVGAPGEDASAALAALGGSPSTASASTANASAASTPAANAPVATSSASDTASADGGRVRASPYVRKLARERGIALGRLSGSGPRGRIVARDLDNAQPSAVAPAAAALAPTAPTTTTPAPRAAVFDVAPPRDAEVRPLSMMRKTIARRLTESKQTVPHFYLTIDVDGDALHDLRERLNADLAASLADGAPKISLNDLLLKAVAIALVRVPACNAQFTPDALVYHRRVDLSVAVAVDEGLVTPVLRDADRKSVLTIAREVRDLASRAREKKLRPEEMTGGTFSVSNLGMFGIDEFSAVINPPEGAILAVGQMRREPVVRGDAVVPGRRMAMTLSCDHRVIDGAVGATFLKALRSLLEHPSQILAV
ncbi:MAG: pyruvate dehydrogenase complex dihydrolipoamide acetyltransferase [Polyangiaceae bacterium]